MIKPHSSFVAGNKVVIINDSGFAIVSEFYRNDVVLRFVDTRVGVRFLRCGPGRSFWFDKVPFSSLWVFLMKF